MIHTSLADGRWFLLSVCEQLANVGCDVDRAIRWRDKGDMEMSRQAFERALELMDWTTRDAKNKGPRLKELKRMRELMVDYFVYDNVYKSDDAFFQKYFYCFNYAAALQRGR